MEPDEKYWRRPAGEPAPGRELASGQEPAPDREPISDPPTPYPGLTYQGPPRMAPPPAGWRPEHIVVPPNPRALPVQDHDLLDAQESRAAAVTRAVAIAAGLIMIALICSMCARLII